MNGDRINDPGAEERTCVDLREDLENGVAVRVLPFPMVQCFLIGSQGK